MSDKGAEWLAKLEAKRARDEAAKAAAAPVVQTPDPSAFQAAVPSTGDMAALPDEVKKSDEALDKLIDGIDILTAYQKWCGKMTPTVLPGQVESIMISCPVPGHEDKNPSAWVNTDKGLWHCMKCGIGGDKLDLAAFRFGIQDYKTGQSGKAFHDLRREIGKSEGWTFENQNGLLLGLSPEQQRAKAERIMAEAQAEFDAKKNAQTLVSFEMGTGSPSLPAPVLSIETGEQVEEEPFDWSEDGPSLNWELFCKPGTFLDEYMRSVSIDPTPNEFHFFNALQSIGLAQGRVQWWQEGSPLYSNIMVCTLGRTGTGKSRSKYWMNYVLKNALPYDPDSSDRKGAYIMPRAGSGEMLLNLFKGTFQGSKNMPVVETGDVKGFIEYDELSDLISRQSRQGSTIKDTILQLSDTKEEVTNASKAGGIDVAKRSYCMLATSTQPELLRTILSKDDVNSGFLNRFLFVTGTLKHQPAVFRNKIDMDPSVILLKGIRLWCSTNPGPLDFAEGVEAEWLKWYEEKGLGDPRKLDSMTTRLRTTLKRRMLLFAANAMEDKISLDTIEKVQGLYEYFIATYSIISKSVARSAMGEIEDDILEYVTKRQEQGPKWVGLKMIARLKNGKYEREDISRALKTLTALNELQSVVDPPASGRGRPIKGPAYMPVTA